MTTMFPCPAISNFLPPPILAAAAAAAAAEVSMPLPPSIFSQQQQQLFHPLQVIPPEAATAAQVGYPLFPSHPFQQHQQQHLPHHLVQQLVMQQAAGKLLSPPHHHHPSGRDAVLLQMLAMTADRRRPDLDLVNLMTSAADLGVLLLQESSTTRPTDVSDRKLPTNSVGLTLPAAKLSELSHG